jgi:hypothetical protein
MMGLSVYIALAAVLGVGLVIYILARVARGSEGLGFRLGFILFLAIGIACGAVIAVGLMLPSSAPPLLKLPWVVPIVLLALFTMYFAGSAITERSWLLLCVALFGLAILAYLILALLEIPIPLHLHGMSVWHWILVGLAICFGVETAIGVYSLLKTPSWGNLVIVLVCFTATAWMILALLEIPIPTPWYMIVFGVGGTAYFIYLWKHRYDPNVSIKIGRYYEAPVGLRELVLLYGIIWVVAMTWYGIGGLFDQEYVRSWRDISLKVEKLWVWVVLILTVGMFLVSIFSALDTLISELRKPPDAPRHVLARVAEALSVTVLIGVVTVVNWWVLF